MPSIVNFVRDLAIHQFVDWSYQFTTSLDLTGYTGRALLRENFEATIGTEFLLDFIDRSPARIQLSLNSIQTTTIAPGTYVFDVIVTSPTGQTLKLIYGRAIVAGGSSGEGTAAISFQALINEAILDQDDRFALELALAIANHNSNPAAHPGLQSGSGTISNYERTFVQSSLTIANLLVVIHNLHTIPSGVSIFDADGNQIIPDKITILSVDSIAIDFSSFVPIVGTWQLSIGV